MQAPAVQWVFRKKAKLQHGNRLLICGSIAQLGAWDQRRALAMNWTDGDNWELKVEVQNGLLEYKHLIIDQRGTITWQEGSNIILDPQVGKTLPQEFVLMSYNVRFDNPKDKQFAWTYRREGAVRVLLQLMPSVIGVQQALKHQKEQLAEGLKSLYEYYGKARDLGDGQQCGIFYLRHRFKLHGEGMVWFNETRTPGQKGFQARLPRNLTYLILEDTLLKATVGIINTHLDHQSERSQTQSCKIIAQTCNSLQSVRHLDGLFICGDFNVTDDHKNVAALRECKYKFSSCRQTAQESDKSATFHNFMADNLLVKIADKLVGDWTAIDHVFYSSPVFVPKAFRVLKSQKPYLSDHHPVVATFKLKVQ